MTDYQYFTNNIASLYKQYGHRFLVIKNQQVIGVYDGFDVAFDSTVKTEQLGTFIIQECVENPETLVLHFQANVSVA